MQVMSQKMLGTAIRDQEVKHSELETAIRCTPYSAGALSSGTMVVLPQGVACSQRKLGGFLFGWLVWIGLFFVFVFFSRNSHVSFAAIRNARKLTHHSAPYICKLFPLMHLIP